MKPYQERVVAEKAHLDERLGYLNRFIMSETFVGVDQDEKDRLVRQRSAMLQYSSVLAERIEAFHD